MLVFLELFDPLFPSCCGSRESILIFIMIVFFVDIVYYTVLENVGKLKVRLVRRDGDLTKTVYVDYRSEDGTAVADDDYVPIQGLSPWNPCPI